MTKSNKNSLILQSGQVLIFFHFLDTESEVGRLLLNLIFVRAVVELLSFRLNPDNPVLDYISILRAMNGVNAMVSYERKKHGYRKILFFPYPDSQSGVGGGAAPFLGGGDGEGVRCCLLFE